MLISDLRDNSDAYIVVKRIITLADPNNANKRNKKLAFKNNVPFRWSIWKVNKTFIDNIEDLDIVMSMYDLLEYSDSYSVT